jgi:hypothetical protein
MIDGTGIHGLILHYALLFAFFGSAFFVWLYLWSQKKLDMDEEPKLRMMEKDHE